MLDDHKNNLKKVLNYIDDSIELAKHKMKYNRKHNHHMNQYIIDYIDLEKNKAIKKRILKYI